MISGDTEGKKTLFLNVGTEKEPKLAKGRLVEADGKPIKAGSHKLAERYSWIHTADWDADGLKDLLVGHNCTVILYKNVGTGSAPLFQAPVAIKIPEGKFPFRPAPYVVDWDGDGKKDLLVGGGYPNVYLYRNVGSNEKPQLARGEVLNLSGPGPDAGHVWRIDVVDWNTDGKKDLLLGNVCPRRNYVPRPGGVDQGGNIWLFLGK